MPPLPDLKRRAREMLRPLQDKLVARGAAPVQLTYAAVGLSTAVGAMIVVIPGILPGTHAWLVLLPAALAARVLLGILRDMLAAEQASQTPNSLLLREIGDALSDILLYLPLALYPGMPAGLIVGFVALGLCTEIAGLAALQIGAGRRREGPMAMNDRAIVFGIVGLIVAMDPSAVRWLPWLLVPASALALTTIASRMRAALRASAPGTDARGNGD
ncbi:MAG: hypothetical protein K9L70_10535 [Thiohalocapsa sp.]|nr:hypothetical protein [Thiohalocapsa sp.]MCF7992577.1 hypothetical protein [Thiohalocapsa sp.]